MNAAVATADGSGRARETLRPTIRGGDARAGASKAPMVDTSMPATTIAATGIVAVAYIRSRIATETDARSPCATRAIVRRFQVSAAAPAGSDAIAAGTNWARPSAARAIGWCVRS
jgi:hypothetical protein